MTQTLGLRSPSSLARWVPLGVVKRDYGVGSLEGARKLLRPGPQSCWCSWTLGVRPVNLARKGSQSADK
jgi:hypothetical protein